LNSELTTILSIAGFDPSGCAGLLADNKTIEANGGYCIAVNSANTMQNDTEFTNVYWTSEEQILEQYRILKRRFRFDVVKIGLIQNFEVLKNIVNELVADNSSVKIVWDPILRASAGFEFHSKVSEKELVEILQKIYLITPNLEEIKVLFPNLNPNDAGRTMQKYCNVLVKGGHGNGLESNDILFYNQNEYVLTGERKQNFSKRGTGCVLSSAIATNLAKGFKLPDACLNAKEYVTKYIVSNTSLIGEHEYEWRNGRTGEQKNG
jgi:hydroxymethylpyrimidine/phosphomethylpyrimidine kinase